MMISASPPTAASSPGAVAPMQAGYGASLTDVWAFEQALAAAGAGLPAHMPSHAAAVASPALQALLEPLEQIDGETSQLSARMQAASSAVQPLSPGEIVALTAQCHQFMFHCQLVSTAANRTCDGLQQLFRQQS